MTDGRDGGMREEPEDAGETWHYRSYLLRLWREHDNVESRRKGKTPLWRASLENSQSGEREGFASLMELFHFIWKETVGESGSDSSSSPTGKGGGASENE